MGSYHQASCLITLKSVQVKLDLLFFLHHNMMSFKTLVICSVIVYAQATKPDVLAKRDSSVEVDPYAAYYEAYSQQVQPLTQGLTEKQGFAGAMENVLGDDAALVLGTIGAIMGTLAAIGVVLNNNNVHELSTDQDSICTTTKAIGNTALTLSALTDITTTNPTNTQIVTRLNLIENAINNWATPDC